jgi:hypothetical protein
LLRDENVQKVDVVLYQFDFETRHLLHDYLKGEITLEAMVENYKKINSKAWHDISLLAPILEFAKENPRIKLHAGSCPEHYVDQALKKGLKSVVQ